MDNTPRPTRPPQRRTGGRPRFYPSEAERMRSIHISLPQEDFALLQAIGAGNASAAVRTVLAFWRAQQHEG